MAIKVGGTEVISDARKFTVTDATGVYSDFQPMSTTSLSDYGPTAFSISAVTGGHQDKGSSAKMTGNVTWSLTGVSPGRQFTLFVDASSSGYDQAWSFSGGTVLFPNDSEPDWTTARYWLHRITCWSSDTVSVVSTSWGS